MRWGSRRWRLSLAKLRDGFQQLLAVTEGADAERLEILQGQIREELLVDVIGLERLGVLAEADRFEPS